MSTASHTLKLDGTFSVTGQSFTNDVEGQTLEYKYDTFARDASSVVYDAAKVGTEPTYWIKVTGDINAFVTHKASDVSGVDDGWGLNEISLNAVETLINSTNTLVITEASNLGGQWTAEYNLPQISETVQIGQVDVVNSTNSVAFENNETYSDNEATGSFTLVVDVTSTTGGVLTFTTGSWSGTDITPLVSERSALEQHLYKYVKWDGAAGSTNGTDVDELTITYNATNDTDTDLNTDVTAYFAPYQGSNIIQGWSASINAIPAANDSIITNIANIKGKDYEVIGTTLFDPLTTIYVNDGGLTKPINVTMKKLESADATNVTTHNLLTSEAIGIALVQYQPPLTPVYFTEDENGDPTGSGTYSNGTQYDIVYDAETNSFTSHPSDGTFTITSTDGASTTYTDENGKTLVFTYTDVTGLFITSGTATNKNDLKASDNGRLTYQQPTPLDFGYYPVVYLIDESQVIIYESDPTTAVIDGTFTRSNTGDSKTSQIRIAYDNENNFFTLSFPNDTTLSLPGLVSTPNETGETLFTVLGDASDTDKIRFVREDGAQGNPIELHVDGVGGVFTSVISNGDIYTI
jgi:hypothetical protein